MMQVRWKETAAECLISLLACIPQAIYDGLSKAGGKLLDKQKGHIARASVQLALPDTQASEADAIARYSARHSLELCSLAAPVKGYPLSAPQPDNCAAGNEENRGAIIISLHTGPPDLGTMALNAQAFRSKPLLALASTVRGSIVWGDKP